MPGPFLPLPGIESQNQKHHLDCSFQSYLPVLSQQMSQSFQHVCYWFLWTSLKSCQPVRISFVSLSKPCFKQEPIFVSKIDTFLLSIFLHCYPKSNHEASRTEIRVIVIVIVITEYSDCTSFPPSGLPESVSPELQFVMLLSLDLGLKHSKANILTPGCGEGK